MPARLIDLRYAASCATCGEHLPNGTRAWWDRDIKCVSCQRCVARTESGAAAGDFYVKAAPMPESGVAGASARAEYERRQRRGQQPVLQSHPRLARLMVALSREPQSTEAWAKGADGEQRVAASLDSLMTCGAVVLHDRQMPGSRANIDHIVVAPSGVWVVDAKSYSGRVERRDRGRLVRGDLQLYVDGRDRSKLVAGMTKQVAAVRRAVDSEDIPIHPVLCFTGSEWCLLAKPFTVDGVIVTWPQALARTISCAADRYIAVSQICGRLVTRLPSACSAQSSGH
jgi:hypothetical protein